jgi:hypothetical protein
MAKRRRLWKNTRQADMKSARADVKSGRAFLTTIPKSGTHVLTAFLPMVGIDRTPSGHEELVETGEFLYMARRWPEAAERLMKHDVSAERVREMEERFARALESFRTLVRNTGPGQYVFFHYLFHPLLLEAVREAGLPIVFLYRDPRDLVISMMNHILRDRAQRKHSLLARLATEEARLLALIEGSPRQGADWGAYPLEALYGRYDGWREQSDVLCLRFEDVIGPRGGGSLRRQYRAFERLVEHLGVEVASPQLHNQVDSLYSEAEPVFVKGQIGEWNERFSPAVRKRFEGGSWIERWGYRVGETARWRPHSLGEAEEEIAAMRSRLFEVSRERNELHRGKWLFRGQIETLKGQVDALKDQLQRLECVAPGPSKTGS